MTKENIVSTENKEVKEAFTSSKGTKIYCLIDPLNISALRGVAAEAAERFRRMNITERELKALIREYKVSVNTNQDFVKANSIVQEIDFRLEMICEANSLIDLSCIYYMIEGENIDVATDHYNKMKRDICVKEPDVRTFFILAGLSLTQQFSSEQGQNLLIYLEEMREYTERIYRYIAK